MGLSQRVLTIYDKPMWESIERQKLELQCCSGCGKFRYPPGPTCPSCLSMDYRWQVIEGRGTILSWVVFHRKYFEDHKPPYNVVAVQIVEGPIIVTNLIGEEPKDSWIGKEVVFVYRSHQGRMQHAVRLVADGGTTSAAGGTSS